MAVGWSLKDLFAATAAAVEATAVNCTTCPVSLQCLAGQDGLGQKATCCGATAVVDLTGPGRQLLILDCNKHRFGTPLHTHPEFGECPMCSGDIVQAHLLGHVETHRYVPTVHAAVPIATRLAVWRKALPEAERFKRHVDATKAARKP